MKEVLNHLFAFAVAICLAAVVFIFFHYEYENRYICKKCGAAKTDIDYYVFGVNFYSLSHRDESLVYVGGRCQSAGDHDFIVLYSRGVVHATGDIRRRRFFEDLLDEQKSDPKKASAIYDKYKSNNYTVQDQCITNVVPAVPAH